MKISFLLSFLLVGTLTVISQTQVISDGETTGLNWWTAGSAGGIDYWDNPSKDDVNQTDKAITVWINNGDSDFTGGGISDLNISTSTYKSISVLIYKKINGTVRLELQDSENSVTEFVTQEYTSAGNWQKLEFQIPASLEKITTLLVAPHFVDTNASPIDTGIDDANRMWWDELVASSTITTSIADDVVNTDIVSTQIYSLNGHLLEVLKDNASVYDTSLPKGIYILKKIDSLGAATVSKSVKTH
ncbi:hypothetical protein [Dysgonomonas sp. 520]|uniref:hypothetical protein n=1 Tax=Dysgonomonas sp. 520 TaxID=2302931 RepID=UPI0013D28206|nr:hypothetical protein [Dysgonomonas sp. 520]NDW10970.1 hypothetical protein [Dysgonomonas sp. 520]